jgi:hypothetical protein
MIINLYNLMVDNANLNPSEIIIKGIYKKINNNLTIEKIFHSTIVKDFIITSKYKNNNFRIRRRIILFN